MFELDNRQIATLLWFGIIVILIFVLPKIRHAFLPAFKTFLGTLFKWQIILPFMVYFLYAAAIILLASNLGLWHPNLLVDTVIIILFTGIPSFINANTLKGGNYLVKDALRDTLGISALVVFYIGLEPFSLFGEFLLLPIVTLLVIFSVVAKRNPAHKVIERTANLLLGLIGIWLIIHTSQVATSTWTNKELSQSLQELLLSILLPLALLPVVYIFAIVMRYELIFKSLHHFFDNHKPPAYAYMTLLLMLNVRLVRLNDFIGTWRIEFGKTKNFREAIALLRKYNAAVRVHDRKLREYTKHMRRMTGRQGVDSNGLQLDRREYFESKNELSSLLYMQMGQFKNNSRYNPDFPVNAILKLQDVTMKVRKDNMAWYAWRKMPNGYYFGVGGTRHVKDTWFYDGAEAPVGWPSAKVLKWRNSKHSERSSEWEFRDEAPRFIESSDSSID